MKILFVGDTHMDAYAIHAANDMSKENEVDLIIQVGDFGYTFDKTPDGVVFLDAVAKAPAPWMFIRGNHDSTSWLREASGLEHLHGSEPVEVGTNLQWIPDGCFIELDGITFSFMGGAYSIDIAVRTVDVSYWEDEFPSAIATDKTADILVSHDLPESLFVMAYNSMLWALLPKIGEKHEVLAKSSRAIIQDWYEQISPGLVIHGHYHVDYKMYDPAIVGLSENGSYGSMWILDTEKYNLISPHTYNLK